MHCRCLNDSTFHWIGQVEHFGHANCPDSDLMWLFCGHLGCKWRTSRPSLTTWTAAASSPSRVPENQRWPRVLQRSRCWSRFPACQCWRRERRPSSGGLWWASAARSSRCSSSQPFSGVPGSRTGRWRSRICWRGPKMRSVSTSSSQMVKKMPQMSRKASNDLGFFLQSRCRESASAHHVNA